MAHLSSRSQRRLLSVLFIEALCSRRHGIGKSTIDSMQVLMYPSWQRFA
jgi:hypothetical protein